jgi:hypothetical protein
MNARARIKRLEVETRRRSRARNERRPLYFRKGELQGGEGLSLSNFEKSYAAYKAATRGDKP